MGVTTTQYTRKPLHVAAVRITSDNFEAIADWCQGEIQTEGADYTPGSAPGKQYIHVRVHNPKNTRQTKAFVGDWLLYTERGYKIYTHKAFQAAFDETNEGQTTYPYGEGDVTVLGPECFVQRDGELLCWKGVNYVPQTTHEDVYMGSEEIMPGVTVNQVVESAQGNGTPENPERADEFNGHGHPDAEVRETPSEQLEGS